MSAVEFLERLRMLEERTRKLFHDHQNIETLAHRTVTTLTSHLQALCGVTGLTVAGLLAGGVSRPDHLYFSVGLLILFWLGAALPFFNARRGLKRLKWAMEEVVNEQQLVNERDLLQNEFTDWVTPTVDPIAADSTDSTPAPAPAPAPALEQDEFNSRVKHLGIAVIDVNSLDYELGAVHMLAFIVFIMGSMMIGIAYYHCYVKSGKIPDVLVADV